MKILIMLLFLLLLSLQYQLWRGEGGYTNWQQLQEMITEQQQENAALKQRNHLGLQEIEDLKQGTTLIEARARLELGMIKQGEVFYQIVD